MPGELDYTEEEKQFNDECMGQGTEYWEVDWEFRRGFKGGDSSVGTEVAIVTCKYTASTQLLQHKTIVAVKKQRGHCRINHRRRHLYIRAKSRRPREFRLASMATKLSRESSITTSSISRGNATSRRSQRRLAPGTPSSLSVTTSRLNSADD